VVIYKKSGNDLLYLALKPTPGPDYQYEYYVVTGYVEDGESIEDGAIREVKEEVNLDIVKLTNLNYQFEYDDRWGGHCLEHCFGGLINKGKIILNEEHVDYKWMPKAEFIEKLWWFGGDKKVLQMLINRVNT
jgi:8-oxo-dGTP pyrophosphatase MutT (NUDIX family)